MISGKQQPCCRMGSELLAKVQTVFEDGRFRGYESKLLSFEKGKYISFFSLGRNPTMDGQLIQGAPCPSMNGRNLQGAPWPAMDGCNIQWAPCSATDGHNL